MSPRGRLSPFSTWARGTTVIRKRPLSTMVGLVAPAPAWPMACMAASRTSSGPLTKNGLPLGSLMTTYLKSLSCRIGPRASLTTASSNCQRPAAAPSCDRAADSSALRRKISDMLEALDQAVKQPTAKKPSMTSTRLGTRICLVMDLLCMAQPPYNWSQG